MSYIIIYIIIFLYNQQVSVCLSHPSLEVCQEDVEDGGLCLTFSLSARAPYFEVALAGTILAWWNWLIMWWVCLLSLTGGLYIAGWGWQSQQLNAECWVLYPCWFHDCFLQSLMNWDQVIYGCKHLVKREIGWWNFEMKVKKLKHGYYTKLFTALLSPAICPSLTSSTSFVTAGITGFFLVQESAAHKVDLAQLPPPVAARLLYDSFNSIVPDSRVLLLCH